MEDQITEFEEKQLFAQMVRHHSPEYYEGLFGNVIQHRGLPIRTKDGGTTDADYDNCIDSPPNYPVDPDYPDRYCTGGYYCKMSNRKWGCRYSIPKEQGKPKAPTKKSTNVLHSEL